jgi:hypothetical protein
MGGAIGGAIGILYGSSPLRGLVYAMGSGCIILGLVRCYQAYSKPFDVRPFHLRDLFGTVWTPPKIGGPTKPQMWIEGIFEIALGIIGLVVFRHLAVAAAH